MLLPETKLAQRAVWILETLYSTGAPTADKALAERVQCRLGASTEHWGRFKTDYDLTGLLAEHARWVCHASVPECSTCELQKFCNYYRQQMQACWRSDETSPTVIDLFCGAGGASLGFSRAGFKILLAVDINDSALMTYRLNHPELPETQVLKQDLFQLEDPAIAAAFKKRVIKLLNGQKVDVVVGGPPCQGFSQIGTDGRSSARSLWNGEGTPDDLQESSFKYDPRNRLYKYFLMMVEWLQPNACLMENVPAMVTIGGGRVARQIVQDFHALGYGLITGIYNAANYGVPQRRRRALFLAFKENQSQFADPSATCTGVITLGEAISDLPPLAAGTGHEVVHRPKNVQKSDYARSLSHRTELIHNHVARPHMDTDLELYAKLQPGESIKDRPDLLNNNRLFRYKNRDRFKDIYRRQDYNAPSTTVIAHLSRDGNMYIHPTQTRTYTVREAARVQSFPDDYIFSGSRTAQFRQVGNAIPPLLVQPFAELISTLLGHRKGQGNHLVQARLPI